jgi:two-component system, OmpR family, sensor histidine kinase BaeS
MTIRRLWLLVLILVAVISVTINAFILSSLTNRYFADYRADVYENHYNEILDYSKSALLTKELSVKQMAMELETHLDDPIIHIKLYDQAGNLLVDVSEDDHIMMGRSMMDMMRSRYDDTDSEVDHVEILDEGIVIGQLNISRYSSLEDSIVVRRFKSSLIVNSLYSIAIVLGIALIIGIFVSRKMSKDLTSTARMAHDLNIGEDTNTVDTNINEIRTIQQSLVELKSKLKLKNKSRKVLIDELVHQTRTPLTVLKTHLEGFADDIIKMTPEEIKVCENQIENITDIISNMSNMIDAEKDFDVLKIEEFEIASLLRQITNGLKAQFAKKNIELNLDTSQKIMLNTDKYKLSQIIYNILTNAYKYTNENGEVNLSYSINNNALSIVIEDNGIGINQEDLKKIFDAYYRSNTIHNNQGEGLGLYLASENVKKIEGKIEVSSILGKGSQFSINVQLDLSNKNVVIEKKILL